MISLDGFFEGRGHDLSWHNVDAEFNDFAIKQAKKADVILFGRRTYELMASFWPTEVARKTDPIVASIMNNTPKIVFSRTLRKIREGDSWKNVTLVNNNIFEKIERLKNKSGKEIAVFGSNNFCVSLIKNKFIDEIRVMINPIVIGKGTPLFKGLDKKLNLKLLKTSGFKSGNILLYYKPIY